MCAKLNALFQRLLPKRLLSFLIGRLANSRCVWLKNLLIYFVVKKYKIDLRIAKKTKISDYQTFNEFFTRELKEIFRPINSQPESIISPVDGIVMQFGDIQETKILQAKKINYDLNKLLAKTTYLSHFKNGKFITIYLSPKDCHRVYMPDAGRLLEMIYVPGQLFSVNPKLVKTIPQLFVRNERVVSIFETDWGMMSVVMVGAALVRGIRTSWAEKVCPNDSKAVQFLQYHTQSFELSKGAEMGCFEFGSTVIVLLGADVRILWNEAVDLNIPILLGQSLGKIRKKA